MFKRLGIFLLIAILALSGCSAAATSESPAFMNGSSGAMPPSGADAGEAAAPQEPRAEEQQGQGNGNRIVIRNAELTIVVADPTEAMSTVGSMAESMGGFIVTSNLYKTTTDNGQEVPQGTITVRVPAEQLNEALSQIKGLVQDPENDVRSENVSGQDVTKEYTDLSSRLRNLQEAEEQLREIMASASRTEDVLAVHSQLTQIREEIEVIQGQIQYYEEAAAMSSISVRILALASVQPLEVGGWQPVGVARDATQALIDTMQFLGSTAIWLLIYALPVGLVIFLPLWGLWKLLRRGSKNRAAKAPTPPANPQ